MAESCFVCRRDVDESDPLVLVLVLSLGKVHRAHCSEPCLRETVRKRRIVRVANRWRWTVRSFSTALLVAALGVFWLRHRVPDAQSISYAWREVPLDAPPPGPPIYGPHWPPTDADWMGAFARASWVYPLPGPVRRVSTTDNRIFGPEPPRNHPPICRNEQRCGVDLGGELWGEHVYAVQDGIVDRVQRTSNDERGGHYVRLAHFGGMVFTHYFHLAAVPRRLSRGDQVKAGDVIGLVGDTGIDRSRRHLHFALSILPSNDFLEVYWDPRPLMETWPLRLPAHGTVAGFAPASAGGISRTSGARFLRP